MHLNRLLLLIALLGLSVGPSSAEETAAVNAAPADSEVAAPPVEAAPPAAGGLGSLTIEMPARGMTMSEVESRFGTPREKLEPAGDPPITRWVYADYTVYFESRYVIHTVPHRP